MIYTSMAYHCCAKPCSKDLRSCGGCTCHNINTQKGWDSIVKSKNIYLHIENESQTKLLQENEKVNGKNVRGRSKRRVIK